MPSTSHTQQTIAGVISTIQRGKPSCLPKDMLLRLGLSSSKCLSGTWAGEGLGVRSLRGKGLALKAFSQRWVLLGWSLPCLVGPALSQSLLS